jgi:hypothetical protein
MQAAAMKHLHLVSQWQALAKTCCLQAENVPPESSMGTSQAKFRHARIVLQGSTYLGAKTSVMQCL